MKKNLIATLILAATLVAAPTQMVYAESSQEIEINQPSSWAQEEVSKAVELGCVPEYLQTNYQDPITRQEFVDLYVQTILAAHNSMHHEGWMVREFYGIPDEGVTPEFLLDKIETTWTFKDTDNTNALVAQILGIIDGDDKGNFNPNDTITREQVAQMLLNYTMSGQFFAGAWANECMYDYDEVADWAKMAVNLCTAGNLMQGTTAFVDNGRYLMSTFSPKGLVTREQAILMTYRANGDAKDRYMYGNLLIRGYIYVDATDAHHIKVDGDTVYYKRLGDDGAFENTNGFFKDYTKEEIMAQGLGVKNDSEIFSKEENVARCLSGKHLFYNMSGLYRIEHNPEDQRYLTIITRNKKDFPWWSTAPGSGIMYTNGPHTGWFTPVLYEEGFNDPLTIDDMTGVDEDGNEIWIYPYK